MIIYGLITFKHVINMLEEVFKNTIKEAQGFKMWNLKKLFKDVSTSAASIARHNSHVINENLGVNVIILNITHCQTSDCLHQFTESTELVESIWVQTVMYVRYYKIDT